MIWILKRQVCSWHLSLWHHVWANATMLCTKRFQSKDFDMWTWFHSSLSIFPDLKLWIWPFILFCTTCSAININMSSTGEILAKQKPQLVKVVFFSNSKSMTIKKWKYDHNLTVYSSETRFSKKQVPQWLDFRVAIDSIYSFIHIHLIFNSVVVLNGIDCLSLLRVWVPSDWKPCFIDPAPPLSCCSTRFIPHLATVHTAFS